MNVTNAAATLGAIGGAAGTGKVKYRSKAHYQRMAALSWKDKRLPLGVRFWSKVKKGKAGQCWNWQGCKNDMGYGCFNIDNRMRISSRVAWQLHHGSSPGRLCVLHHCDNPACCNPGHLFLGTRTDNHLDKMKKGRARGPAELIPAQVLEIRKLYAGGMRVFEIQKLFNRSTGCIRDVVLRINWKHI